MARAQELSDALLEAPVIEPAADVDAGPDPSHGVSEHDFGRAVVLGAIAGTVGMTALSFGLAIAGGIDAGTAAAIAPVPGVVAGVFFGGNAFLGRVMAKAEHDR